MERLADVRLDSEILLRAFTASPIGIAVENLDGQPFFVNPALCDMLGFTAEEMCQKHCVQFSPAEDAAKDWALFQQLRAGLIDRYQLEKRYIRRDGSLVWGRLSVSLFATSDAPCVIALVEDITDKKTAQQELERSQANLRQLASELTLAEQRAREQLARALHDNLQQLLFSAGLRVDLIAMRASGLSSEAAGLVSEARRAIDEATETVRTMSLDLFPSILHSGGLPVALSWLAHRMRQQYGLTVDVTLSADADLARKDMRVLVFESVRELLFNVVKHAGTSRATVELSLASNEEIRVVVADEGRGFDPTVAWSRPSGQSVGFGLFSVRERLALLGGRMEITTAPGQGSRFVLFAPRPADTEDTAQVPERPVPATTRVTDHRLTIVVADDHAGVRQHIRELLSSDPKLHVVGEARDGEEAIRQAHTLHPDAIVMDISMPGIDGVEATRRIRAELPDICILGLSIEERMGRSHPIEDAGAVGYFTKSAAGLRDLIDRLFELATSRQAPVR